MEGTLSKRRGLRRAITPADWRASMFWGRWASSATVWTKVTLAFWYASKGAKTARDIQTVVF